MVLCEGGKSSAPRLTDAFARTDFGWTMFRAIDAIVNRHSILVIIFSVITKSLEMLFIPIIIK